MPYCSFCFFLQCVAKYLMDTDQRNDLADKPLHQCLFVQPCGLRSCVMPRISLRLRFGGADRFLRGEPPAVGAAVSSSASDPSCFKSSVSHHGVYARASPVRYPSFCEISRSAAFLSPACIRKASASLQGLSPATVYIFFVTGTPPFLISAVFPPPRKCVPIPYPAHIRQRRSRCPSAPCPDNSPPDTALPAASHRRFFPSGDACGSSRFGY